MTFDDLRERWLLEMTARCLPGTADPNAIMTYRGRPVTGAWPDVATMRRDLGELDSSSDATLEAWIRLADDQTLGEFVEAMMPRAFRGAKVVSFLPRVAP